MKCHRRPPDGMENVKEKVFDQFSDPDWMIYKRNPVRRLKLLPKLPSDSSILHFISPNEIWNVICRLSHSFQSDSTNPAAHSSLLSYVRALISLFLVYLFSRALCLIYWRLTWNVHRLWEEQPWYGLRVSSSRQSHGRPWFITSPKLWPGWTR